MEMYKIEGKYIYFGSYPQSRVSDKNLILELTKIVEKRLNDFNFLMFKNKLESIMYLDIDFNNEKYRSLYLKKDKIFNSNKKENINYNFFKYEPIKWQIYEGPRGKAELLSVNIIDYNCFNTNINKNGTNIDGKTIYSNNYEYSTIRKWLNNDFYNMAFSKDEQEIINTIEVYSNPKIEKSEYESNESYVCNNTFDKVYLLSSLDTRFTYYRSIRERSKKVTNYADYLGAMQSWWLRTTANVSFSTNAVFILSDEDDYTDDGEYYQDVVNIYRGIVPAININISNPTNNYTTTYFEKRRNDLIKRENKAKLNLEKADNYFDNHDYINALKQYKLVKKCFLTTKHYYNTAICYKHLKNFEKSFIIFENVSYHSSDTYKALALNELALHYLYGLGVDRDYEKAKYYFEHASNEGSVDAKYYLGCCYFKLPDFPQNFVEAKYWLSNAADLGDSDAKEELRKLFNNDLAKMWYKPSIKRIKNKIKQNNDFEISIDDILKSAYECLDIKDYTKAKYWFNKALNCGYIQAEDELKKIK